MPILTLLEKLYGSDEADALETLKKTFSNFTSRLDATVTFIGKNARNWIQVEVSGSDTKVTINYLRKRFGLVSPLRDLHMPKILKGKIVDSGKVGYGVYVDIGIYSSHSMDALIPLHKLRSHLTDGKKLSLREIIDTYCLYNNFPISLRLTEINVKEKKIWVEPSDEQVEMFKKWIFTPIDRLIILGVNREKMIFTLNRSGIRRNIMKIDELGLLEHSLLCKLGTNATDVKQILGRYLPGIQVYVFSSRRPLNILNRLLVSRSA